MDEAVEIDPLAEAGGVEGGVEGGGAHANVVAGEGGEEGRESGCLGERLARGGAGMGWDGIGGAG